MLAVREGVQLSGPDHVEILDILGATLSVLSDGTNLPMVAGEHLVPPGYSVPRHVHAADDEVFVILDGELTVCGPAGDTLARAGCCVQLPRGVPHAFRNGSGRPVRLLVILLPGHQALEMFREFDRSGRAAGQATPQEIGATAERYGVRFV